MTTLAIVGSGVSVKNYWRSAEHIWALNTVSLVPQLGTTMHWIMDDLLYCEARQPHYRVQLAAQLMQTGKPIMTSRVHDDIPNCIEYPLNDAIRFLRHKVIKGAPKDLCYTFFNNSLAYPLVYAAMMLEKMEITEIHCHGIDFLGNREEKVRHVQPFILMIGWLWGQGVTVNINPASALFDIMKLQIAHNEPIFYGYYPPPEVEERVKRKYALRRLKDEESLGMFDLSEWEKED